MSSEKLGGWHLTVDLANYVFEGRKDEILGDWGRAIAFFWLSRCLEFKKCQSSVDYTKQGWGKVKKSGGAIANTRYK